MLNSTGQVIDALGGTTAVAKLMGVSKQVVSNWRAMDRFPSHTYLDLKDALKAMRKAAPDELWRMDRRRRAVERQEAAE